MATAELKCHVLPYEAGSGPANMALDEALLERVAGGAETAYLRTYGWTTPTLSLGYFQRLAEVRADARFQNAPLVRRLTGGGAIWHHHEVTYALVINANHPLVHPRAGLYYAVHAAIIAALAEGGIRAARRGGAGRSSPGNQDRPLLCFKGEDPEDIVINGAKIVGSSQRRRGGAVLQHGSLLLAHSSRTPELIGICDMADESTALHAWSDRLLSRIPTALGLRCLDAQAPAQARDHALDLERARYQNPAWTNLR